MTCMTILTTTPTGHGTNEMTNTENESVFEIELLEELKIDLNAIEKSNNDLLTKYQDKLQKDVWRLIFRKFVSNSYDNYNFIYELAAADIGKEAAKTLFYPDVEDPS